MCKTTHANLMRPVPGIGATIAKPFQPERTVWNMLAHQTEVARMLSNCPARSALAGTLVLLAASCSGPVAKPAAINRDAASRCVQKIDAWKKDVVKLDSLQQEFDSIANQIRVDYRKATPEEKTQLRTELHNVITETDETRRSADALFDEILRDLEYVPRDKIIRARITQVTTPLKDAEGARTPEVQQALDAVSSQLQTLVRAD
jgi:hypothetical protein